MAKLRRTRLAELLLFFIVSAFQGFLAMHSVFFEKLLFGKFKVRADDTECAQRLSGALEV